jgi:hypothetical protein
MDEALKIKLGKLLALAESPVPAEAESARRMAERLMEKYDISAAESRSGIVERSFSASGLEQEWECVLLEGILDYTGAEVLYVSSGEEQRALLVGRRARIIKSENLFSYLSSRLTALGRDYEPVVKDVESFRLGMAQAVCESLEGMKVKPEKRPIRREDAGIPACREESGAAAEAEAWLNEHYGRPQEREIRSSFDPNSLGLGRSVGRKIPLLSALDEEH